MQMSGHVNHNKKHCMVLLQWEGWVGDGAGEGYIFIVSPDQLLENAKAEMLVMGAGTWLSG